MEAHIIVKVQIEMMPMTNFSDVARDTMLSFISV